MTILKISFTERTELLYALGRTIRENNETIKDLSCGASTDLISALQIQNKGLEILLEKIKTVKTVG